MRSVGKQSTTAGDMERKEGDLGAGVKCFIEFRDAGRTMCRPSARLNKRFFSDACIQTNSAIPWHRASSLVRFAATMLAKVNAGMLVSAESGACGLCQ